jgi:two-component sensor histidine kinase
VPLALFVTEAVTNALKHAFPRQEGGAIRIVAAEDDEGLVVSVADNGVGLRWAQPAQEATDSLGFTLMGALASQLGGEFRIEDNGGLRTVLTVPRSYARGAGLFEEDRANGPI